MVPSLLALLLAIAVTGFTVLESLRLSRRVRVLEKSLRVLANQRAEQRFAVERRAQLLQAQSFTEGTVQGTTSAVRAIHKSIADIPFGILERIPVTRSTARFVRGIHDRTADGVYDTISTVNRLVGTAARAGVGVGKAKPMKLPPAELILATEHKVASIDAEIKVPLAVETPKPK